MTLNAARAPRMALLALVALVAASTFTLTACSGYEGESNAVGLCTELDENKVTAPDQIARRYYGDGSFAQAAAAIRATCASEHGAVAVYLDQTANYDGSFELIAPPGYGTATQ